MARISIDNGRSFCEVEEVLQAIEWDVVVNYMDDNIRERVHDELAPCTEEEFLNRYLELSDDDLIIG